LEPVQAREKTADVALLQTQMLYALTPLRLMVLLSQAEFTTKELLQLFQQVI